MGCSICKVQLCGNFQAKLLSPSRFLQQQTYSDKSKGLSVHRIQILFQHQAHHRIILPKAEIHDQLLRTVSIHIHEGIPNKFIKRTGQLQNLWLPRACLVFLAAEGDGTGVRVHGLHNGQRFQLIAQPPE